MLLGRRRKRRKVKDAPSSQKLTWAKNRDPKLTMFLQVVGLRIYIEECRKVVTKKAKAKRKRMLILKGNQKSIPLPLKLTKV